MTEQQLASIVRTQIDHGGAYATRYYSGSRELARDYYNSRGKAVGDVCDGDSALLSADVPDSIDATIAAMMPAFNKTDLLAEFEASSPEDEDQAAEESKVVSHILVDGNSGVIRDAIFDCLLLRNTAIKVSWEDKPDVTIQQYENVTMEQAVQAAPQLMGGEGDVEPTSFEENEDGTVNIVLRTKTPRGIPKIECLPIDSLTVNQGHESINVKDCKFISHSPSDVTASDLVEMGFDSDLVDKIPNFNEYTADHERANRAIIDNVDADRSTRSVDVHEAYLLVDFDGDGISERRRVILGGSYILLNEEVDAVQIITGSTWPMPHQWEGVSLFDRLKEIQDGKTDLTRQTINANTYNSLQRVQANPLRVEMDDLATGAKRGVVRCKTPGVDIIPFPPFQLDPSTPALMQQFDKMRSERAGGALDMNMEGLPVAGSNVGSHGVERIMTAMESMVSEYVNNFSQTVIRPLYIEIHRLLRNHGGSMDLKIGGEYIKVDPSQWPERTKLNVVTGAGLGEQSRKGQAMGNVTMTQKELMMAGSGLVNEDTAYKSLIDAAKYQGIDYPEQYYIDPASPEAQQAAQQKQQAAQQAQQAAEQKEQMMAQFQMALVNVVEETKKQGQMLKSMQDKAELDLEIEKEKNDFTTKANEQELKYATDVPGAVV